MRSKGWAATAKNLFPTKSKKKVTIASPEVKQDVTVDLGPADEIEISSQAPPAADRSRLTQPSCSRASIRSTDSAIMAEGEFRFYFTLCFFIFSVKFPLWHIINIFLVLISDTTDQSTKWHTAMGQSTKWHTATTNIPLGSTSAIGGFTITNMNIPDDSLGATGITTDKK